MEGTRPRSAPQQWWHWVSGAAIDKELIEPGLRPAAILCWLALRLSLPAHGLGRVDMELVRRRTRLSGDAFAEGIAELEEAGVLDYFEGKAWLPKVLAHEMPRQRKTRIAQLEAQGLEDFASRARADIRARARAEKESKREKRERGEVEKREPPRENSPRLSSPPTYLPTSRERAKTPPIPDRRTWRNETDCLRGFSYCDATGRRVGRFEGYFVKTARWLGDTRTFIVRKLDEETYRAREWTGGTLTDPGPKASNRCDAIYAYLSKSHATAQQENES